ncbi:MAG: hypothetical protein F6K31_31920 [Symploca sp. SIO2G7]|nr:hypothetical protein [Symploca sp. SIO2G7]
MFIGKRIIKWLLLSILATGLIVGCNLVAGDGEGEQSSGLDPSSQPAHCRSIEHDLGETEICEQPQMFAALSAYTDACPSVNHWPDKSLAVAT